MSAAAFWLWLAFVIGWGAMRWPAMRRARRMKTRQDRRDAFDISLLLFCAICLFVLPMAWRFGGILSPYDRMQPFILTLTGTIIAIAFLWLFRRSHKDLGKNWSVSLEIREGHNLVTGGVYRHVRHPMYASFMLWGLMQAMLIANWVAGLAGLLSVATLFFFRHRREEAMMRAEFGADYDAYAARTARLIPGVY